MEIHFGLIDSREKRWFGKVARAAERAVNKLIKSVGSNECINVHAHFDTSELHRVKIVDYIEGTTSCTQVFFAAGDWETVTDSIPGAIEQLASASTFLVPSELRPHVTERLLSETALRFPVQRSSKDVPSDGLIDFYLYVEDHMESKSFFELIDTIDSELIRLSAGEVSGNAYALSGTGSCIDLVAANRGKAQQIADDQVRAAGIKRYRFVP